MATSYSKLSALKERAAANGITADQFDEVYQGCHDTASFELWDASEEAQNYMAELWTSSVLYSANALKVYHDTAYCAFNPVLHDFSHALNKLECCAMQISSENETITSLEIYGEVSETAVAVAKFALSLGNAPSPQEQRVEEARGDVRSTEEVGHLRDRVQELESLLEHLVERYEELKSLLYDRDA